MSSPVAGLAVAIAMVKSLPRFEADALKQNLTKNRRQPTVLLLLHLLPR